VRRLRTTHPHTPHTAPPTEGREKKDAFCPLRQQIYFCNILYACLLFFSHYDATVYLCLWRGAWTRTTDMHYTLLAIARYYTAGYFLYHRVAMPTSVVPDRAHSAAKQARRCHSLPLLLPATTAAVCLHSLRHSGLTLTRAAASACSACQRADAVVAIFILIRLAADNDSLALVCSVVCCTQLHGVHAAPWQAVLVAGLSSLPLGHVYITYDTPLYPSVI